MARKYIHDEDKAAELRRKRSETSNCEKYIHECKNPQRREESKLSFLNFCLNYFPYEFNIKFSDDHLKTINKIERVVLHGELYALAMPRGSGKTTLCEKAVEWATLYQHRNFVGIIGSDKDASKQILESIITDYESNDLLEEDFSEVCGPIIALEGRSQRCASQHYNEAATNITTRADCLVYATLPNRAGSVVRSYGLTGRIRGAKHKQVNGTTIRPDLVIIDDPQTDATAQSAIEIYKREEALSGAILNLAGPNQKIAAIMPCTVIQKDDLADKMLNRELHPEWQGERMNAIIDFPKNMNLWDEYSETRNNGLRAEDGGEAGNNFYKENRKKMDEGSKVSWNERIKTGDLSALQSLMNFYYMDKKAFFSEMQNDPLVDESTGANLTEDEIELCIRNQSPLIVPGFAGDILTAGIDVHDDLLFWVVCSWSESNFNGHIIDYGVYPKQSGKITQGSAQKPLQKIYSGGRDTAIYNGLCFLCRDLAGRTYKTDGGEILSIAKTLVDTGYKPDLVFQAIIETGHIRLIQGSRGQYIGAKHTPYADKKVNKTKREKVGEGWRESAVDKYRNLRRIFIDTNNWKSFVRARLQTEQGNSGTLTLSKGKHETLIRHLLAERSILVEAAGRKVEEWYNHPGVDNHWFDCLVQATAAANYLGCRLSDGQTIQEVKKKKSQSTKDWFKKAKK